jgi:hypothetical protein
VIAHHCFNPKPLTVTYRRRIIFFFIYLGFPLLIDHMDDVDATYSGNVAIVEKRGCGRPRGSKNKPKSTLAVVASSSTLAKHRPGRPLGSKNKKSFFMTTAPTPAKHHQAICFLSWLLLVPNSVNSDGFVAWKTKKNSYA